MTHSNARRFAFFRKSSEVIYMSMRQKLLAGATVMLLALAVMPVLGLAGPPKVISPTTWQLNNVFFSPQDGGLEWTGSFVFDATTGTITEWNISVPGGVVFPQTVPPYTYTSFSPTASASYQLSATGTAVIRFGTSPLPDLSSGLGPCDSSQPQRCLILETTPLPKDGGKVAVSFGQETFTPIPSNSFNRTIDIGKNPQLISTSADFIATPNVLWPPNHKMVPVTVTVSSTGVSNCQIVSVSSNELITSSYWKITGDLTVSLRAERLGTGRARLYTITLSCMDTFGNNVTGNVTVTVPHDHGDK
jgi:hypothetical protein